MFSQPLFSCLAFAALTAAQITSTCNPLLTSCSPNSGLSASTLNVDFTTSANGWTPSGAVSYSSQGAGFSVASAGQAPTLYSDFYMLFGYVEAKVKAAPGTGIISSLILISDALDEIDWEWLGGNPGNVQTNYYGKGDTGSYDRFTNVAVGAATTTYHTYAIDWTSSYIKWFIDGNLVRTLNYADANGGKNFPQTPCRIGMGPWAGGSSPAQGTRNWAGGPPDFSQGPFTMYVQNVNINNYNPAKSYVYGDKSGSYQSIQIVGGTGSSVVGSGSNSGGSSPGSGSGSASGSGSVSPTSGTTAAAPTPSPTPTTLSTPSPIPTTAPSPTTTAKPTTTTSTSTTTHETTTTTTSATTLRSTTTAAAATSSVSKSASPSTAPNAAPMVSGDLISSILTSVLAITIGMVI